MMEAVAMKDLEEMTFCGYCKQKFNDSDQAPKMLTCKHYFCLRCVHLMVKGLDLFCVNCWKRTELSEKSPETLPTYNPVLQLVHHVSNLKLGITTKPQDKDRKVILSESCHKHGMPLALWCHSCGTAICRACAIPTEHPSHQIRSHNEAKEQLISEAQVELVATSKLLQDMAQLTNQQRAFLLQVLESCMTLKTHIETDLASGWACPVEATETRELLAKARLILPQVETAQEAQALCASLAVEKQRLQARVQEMLFQCQLDDLVGSSAVVFDFNMLKQALASLLTEDSSVQRSQAPAPVNPILFLTNYCMSQLYTRLLVSKQQAQAQGLQNGGLGPESSHLSPQDSPLGFRSSSSYPLFYFNIEVNGESHGRIVIQTRPELAPKMSKNFEVLATGEMGMSYKGCTVFQCWQRESVITGDFESNNGRGGRSIYEEGFFMPDDTKIPAVRGAVGMRRTQKRHDNLGMVGSQFRITLQEMKAFTAIFGHVVEGIELVEKIASFSDNAGKPTKTVVIVSCGKL